MEHEPSGLNPEYKRGCARRNRVPLAGEPLLRCSGAAAQTRDASMARLHAPRRWHWRPLVYLVPAGLFFGNGALQGWERSQCPVPPLAASP